MIAFLDTEFTTLLAPELLSIGLVTLDAREHYVELDLATETGETRAKNSSDFVRGGVLDFWGLVPDSTVSELEMSRRTGEWILGLAAESGNKVEVAFDYAMDYELMEYVIRDCGLWERVREVVSPLNIGALTGSIDGELAAEGCYRELGKRGLHRHHALADALMLMAAYMAVKDAALALHARVKSHESGGSK